MNNTSSDRSFEAQRVLSTPSGSMPSGSYVWYVVVVLCGVNVFNYTDRMALAMLAPLIKADLALTDAQLGLLIGLAFALTYAICGIPIARWADRGIRRDIIAVAITTWGVMTALSGAAQHFWHLLLARVGVGAGEAGSYAPGASILCDYVPLERRAVVFAVHSFGNYAGMLAGMVLAGLLGELIGWRWTFVCLGLPGIALALLVRFTLHEPPRGVLDVVPDEPSEASWRKTLRVLWMSRTYRMLTLFLVVNGFVQYGLNQWWPSYYARVHGLNLASVGVSLGVALGTGSGVGLLIGGLLSHKVAQRDVRLPLIIGAAATALAVPTALGTLLVRSSMLSALLVWLTALFWTVSNGPAMATLFSVARPQMRVTAGALAIFLISVLGFGLGPFCVGMLSDLLTPTLGVQALRYALLVPIALIPVMAMALYAAAQALPRELHIVEAPAAPAIGTASKGAESTA